MTDLNELDIKTARRCLNFNGHFCSNKRCINLSCPLNKKYEKVINKHCGNCKYKEKVCSECGATNKYKKWKKGDQD